MNRIDNVSNNRVDQINAVMESNLSGVVRWSDSVNVLCSTSGKAVIVPHNLNAVPTEIDIRKWGDTSWWIAEEDRTTWNDRIVVFHATFGRYTVKAGVR